MENAFKEYAEQQLFEGAIDKRLLNKYDFYTFEHAIDILVQTHPKEWAEILSALRRFDIKKEDVIKGGGSKSAIPKKFDELLFPQKWKEERIKADLLVKRFKRNTRTVNGQSFKPDETEEMIIEGFIDGHHIDFVKGSVAIDVEWNSKDQTFDRDLFAMRNYFDARIIDVGIIITRSVELEEELKRMNIGGKYGKSTTRIDQLLPRLKARRNGACPILAIAMGKKCLRASQEGK